MVSPSRLPLARKGDWQNALTSATGVTRSVGVTVNGAATRKRRRFALRHVFRDEKLH